MIIPVIIENSEAEIKKRVEISKNFAPLVQIDICEKDAVGADTIQDLDLIAKITSPLKIELDLMVKDPLHYLQKRIDNIEKVSYYVKEGDEVEKFLTQANKLGYKAGLGIGPETNIASIYANAALLDFVQFYTVTPGAKGRPFQQDVIKDITDFHLKYPSIKIQTDGGINETNIKDLQTAGVTDFVVGSALFNASNPAQIYIKLDNMDIDTNIDQINTIMNFPGKEALKQVAILGGAAWKPGEEPYTQAFDTSKALAENGYEVVNGGGPGVMEASTKGAHAGGGHVLAITYYPNKPKRHYEGRAPENDFDTEVKTLDYFDRTKVILQTTQAHIVFKGSLGTLSEFGMTWISSWIHEPHNKPIILYGEFWQEFIDLIEKHMLVVNNEKKLLKICTTPQEVIDYLATFK